MNNNDRTYEEKLSAYLDGTLSDNERAEVDVWLEGSEDARLLLARMKKLDVMASESLSDIDDDLLNKLEHRINSEIEHLPDQTTVSKKAKIIPIWYRTAAIAASVVFIFLLGRMMLEDTDKPLLEVEHRSSDKPEAIDYRQLDDAENRPTDANEFDKDVATGVESEEPSRANIELQKAESSGSAEDIERDEMPAIIPEPIEEKEAAIPKPSPKPTGEGFFEAPKIDKVSTTSNLAEESKTVGKSKHRDRAQTSVVPVESEAEITQGTITDGSASETISGTSSVDDKTVDSNELFFNNSILNDHPSLSEYYASAVVPDAASSKKAQSYRKLASSMMPDDSQTAVQRLEISFDKDMAAASENPYDMLTVYYKYLRQSYDLYQQTGDDAALEYCKNIKADCEKYIISLERQNLAGGPAKTYINELREFDLAP